MGTDDLESLLRLAKEADMSPSQLEEQRRSFAYGNTKIENERITRSTIDQQAEKLAQKDEREPS